MFLFAFLAVLGICEASTTCDMNQYCRSMGGPLSYCKDWQKVSSCFGAETVKNCSTCGVVGGTTKAPTPTTKRAINSTKAPTTTTKSAITSTKAPTTTTKSAITSTKAPTTTTQRAITSTKAPTTTTRAADGVVTTVKPTSTTAGPSRSVVSNTTVITSPAATSSTRMSTTTVTTTTRTTTRTTPIPPPPANTKVTSNCGAMPIYQTPMFLWIEMPAIQTRAEFTAFYQRLAVFLTSNCANIRAHTLVIRVNHPAFPTRGGEPMFWPPSSSPLFTELISKLGVETSVKILLYPYVMEDFDRTKWVQFAQDQNVTPLVNNQTSVLDGIYKFTQGWQDLVNKTSKSFVIEGFMIDNEELTAILGTQNKFNLSVESLSPYKAAFPLIKVGTTLGYDDLKRVKLLDPVIDYFHQQVYDFYYPYSGADRSPTDSIFEVYRDNPTEFYKVVMSNVLMPALLKAYAGRESKVMLMWSSQTMTSGGCIYPMGSARCGINYEFNWSPERFNQFMELVQKTPGWSAFQHGLYTYNFIRQDWLIKSSRQP